MKLEDREKRKWWAIADGGDVREVTGYSCAPMNPNMWWCPEVGFSGTEGHHLFRTRDEAFIKAIIAAERDYVEITDRIKKLKRKRFGL